MAPAYVLARFLMHEYEIGATRNYCGAGRAIGVLGRLQLK
jgi:CRISPR/Cas system endoribonuclease Cas6 (RAMP superfamily)